TQRETGRRGRSGRGYVGTDGTRRVGRGRGRGGDGRLGASRPTLSVAVDFHHLDVFEVQVHREGGLEMVAAIELVSPRNKDRQTARRHFAAKCAAYLQAGVSVILVDVVTGRRQNLYANLLEQLALPQDENGQGELY